MFTLGPWSEDDQAHQRDADDDPAEGFDLIGSDERGGDRAAHELLDERQQHPQQTGPEDRTKDRGGAPPLRTTCEFFWKAGSEIATMPDPQQRGGSALP